MHFSAKDNFLEALKQYTVPVAAAVYVLGYAAKLHEYIDKVGWRVASVAILLLGVAWAVYVWSATEISLIEPRVQRRKFNSKHRWGAVLLAAASAAPVWFAIQPVAPFRIPSLVVEISNPTNAPVEIVQLGEFYLTAVSSPLMEAQVAAGKIRFVDVENPKSSTLVVPPGGRIELLAVVINPLRFKQFLEAEEFSMRIIAMQTNGTTLTRADIPFDANELKSSYIEIATK